MVTTQRDLRTGRPIWAATRLRSVPRHGRKGDISVDVIIVGAGITGAIIADVLSSAGLRVALADKRGLVQGSTLASTALVQYELDTPLRTLARKIGREKAIRSWRRSRLAVESLAARLGELAIPDVVRRDTLYLAGDVLNQAQLYQEHEARRAAGLASRFLDRQALRKDYGIRRSAALKSYDNLVIDPRKTTLALLRAAAEKGSEIFPNEDIVEVVPGNAGVVAYSRKGRRLRSDFLIFATGYELPDGVPRRHHKITSTWAIATAPQARRHLWPGECCIWEASDPYLYIRTSAGGRVICGGADEDIGDADERDALIGRKTKVLTGKLHRLLPALDLRIDFAWAGAFGVTTTGLPIIDQVPGMPRCWVALGYGGNGTTYAAIAAEVIAGALLGKPDVDADLFRFS